MVYMGLIVIVSIGVSILSRAVLIQYLLICILGTLSYYAIAIFLSESGLLSWLGRYSYPLFLFHEPVIGRLVGSILQGMGVSVSIGYVIPWAVCTLLLTILLVKAFELIKLDSVLWKFMVGMQRKTVT